uniref:DM domain-containing protein n=1 Tax=Meloidogyne javanica TaxID=6303 RepID=A0A915LYU3_MELJA
MVIKRRRLNKALNSRRHGKGKFKLIKKPSGSKLRNPTCARCSAHGKESTLRGHKKTLCPFRICYCEKCCLVEERRRLMAAQIKLRRRQKIRVRAPNIHDDENDKLFPHIFNANNCCFSGSSNITKQQKLIKQYISRSQQNPFKDKGQEEFIETPDLPTHSQYLQRQHFQHTSQLPSNFPLVEQFTSEITQNQHRQPIYFSFNNSPQQQYCINPHPPTITPNIHRTYTINAAMRNNSLAPQLYLISQQRPVGGQLLVYSQPSLQPFSQLGHQQVGTLISNTSQQIDSQQKQNFLQQISTTSQQASNTSSLYELFSSLPTSILAQIPPTNLIHN